jgi:hypothetical protein
MTLYILQTFSVQDEEIQTIHLPVVFAAVVEVLSVSNVSSFMAIQFDQSHTYSYE